MEDGERARKVREGMYRWESHRFLRVGDFLGEPQGSSDITRMVIDQTLRRSEFMQKMLPFASDVEDFVKFLRSKRKQKLDPNSPDDLLRKDENVYFEAIKWRARKEGVDLVGRGSRRDCHSQIVANQLVCALSTKSRGGKLVDEKNRRRRRDSKKVTECSASVKFRLVTADTIESLKIQTNRMLLESLLRIFGGTIPKIGEFGEGWYVCEVIHEHSGHAQKALSSSPDDSASEGYAKRRKQAHASTSSAKQ